MHLAKENICGLSYNCLCIVSVIYIIMHLVKEKTCGLNYSLLSIVHENYFCRENYS